MTVLYDDELGVHYGFASLVPDPFAECDLAAARAGQRNGLLGARLPGMLHLATGTHTGSVPLRIEWHAEEPVLADEWEDVVEVPFVPAGRDYVLAAFEEFHDIVLPADGPHRVRYSARALDAARDNADPGDLSEEEFLALEAPDRYLLQLWPATARPDAIVREASDVARYWHSV